MVVGPEARRSVGLARPELAIARVTEAGHDVALLVELAIEPLRLPAEVFLRVLAGAGFAEPNPSPMFPNPPGLLRPEPHSPGLRDRIWVGRGVAPHRRVGGEAGHEHPNQLGVAYNAHEIESILKYVASELG